MYVNTLDRTIRTGPRGKLLLTSVDLCNVHKLPQRGLEEEAIPGLDLAAGTSSKSR
jgi:hypothetical protein